jgi:hypothetical protein
MSLRFIAGTLLLCGLGAVAQAAPGDPYVPAHRTRDGHYVPPNVAPLSAGTYPSSQPRRNARAAHAAHAAHAPGAALAPPLLSDARALPR